MKTLTSGYGSIRKHRTCRALATVRSKRAALWQLCARNGYALTTVRSKWLPWGSRALEVAALCPLCTRNGCANSRQRELHRRTKWLAQFRPYRQRRSKWPLEDRHPLFVCCRDQLLPVLPHPDRTSVGGAQVLGKSVWWKIGGGQGGSPTGFP